MIGTRDVTMCTDVVYGKHFITTFTDIVYGKHFRTHLSQISLKMISRVPVRGRALLENAIRYRDSDFTVV